MNPLAQTYTGTCKSCGMSVIGFVIDNHDNHDIRFIDWKHADGNTYRHMIQVESPTLLVSKEVI
jgi:hypothetical protein